MIILNKVDDNTIWITDDENDPTGKEFSYPETMNEKNQYLTALSEYFGFNKGKSEGLV